MAPTVRAAITAVPAALLVACAALGLSGCDTETVAPMPSPVSVPAVAPGPAAPPAGGGDRGVVAPPPAADRDDDLDDGGGEGRDDAGDDTLDGGGDDGPDD